MSSDNILDFDAEDVEVHPWCGLHDVRLENERAPMSAMPDDKDHVYTMDLSWSGCPTLNKWVNGYSRSVLPDVIDAGIEVDQESWYTKVTVLLK